jgi:hypothetical protein
VTTTEGEEPPKASEDLLKTRPAICGEMGQLSENLDFCRTAARNQFALLATPDSSRHQFRPRPAQWVRATGATRLLAHLLDGPFHHCVEFSPAAHLGNLFDDTGYYVNRCCKLQRVMVLAATVLRIHKKHKIGRKSSEHCPTTRFAGRVIGRESLPNALIGLLFQRRRNQGSLLEYRDTVSGRDSCL